MKQGVGYRTTTETGDLSVGKARLCYHRCESVMGCEPLLRVSFAQSLHLTVHGVIERQSHREPAFMDSLLMGLLGLFKEGEYPKSFYFSHALLVNIGF